MTATDICTVVWPLLEPSEEASSEPYPAADAWIVGWNPQGLSVVVAWFLPQAPLSKAVETLDDIKKCLKNHRPPPGLPSFQTLQILGYVRGPSATKETASGTPALPEAGSEYFGSPVSQLPAVLRDGSVRQMRQTSDIWLDLAEGPMLGEVWCCGYRVQSCQLHVVRCEPNKWLTCKPTVFSATAIYGPDGIRQLRNGKRPITIPGSLSTAEGIMLPDVLRRECAPRTLGCNSETPPVSATAAAALGADDLTSSLRSPLNPSKKGQSSTNQTTPHKTTVPSDPDESSVPSSVESSVNNRRHSSLEFDTSGLITNQSQSFPYMSVFDATKAAPPRSGVPPRLDFPTTNDDGELSYMLRMSQACLRVRRVIEALDAREGGSTEWSAQSSSEDDSYTANQSGLEDSDALKTDKKGWGPLTFLSSVALYLLLCVLPILSQLGRFLWTMEVLEIRVRETINLLSLWCGKTHSCGLHPAIPHLSAPQWKRRLFCYLNFLSGMLVDVLLGHCMRLVLLTGGPPLHHMAQSLTRRYLYETHMSYLDWFDGWPAGLKVNEELNRTLCFFAKMVVSYWDALMRWPLDLIEWGPHAAAAGSTSSTALFVGGVQLPPLPTMADPSGPTEYLWIVPSYGLMLTLSFFGASFACALVADLTGIVTLHLRVLYHLAGLLYRGSKVVLKHCLSQFRGLKYNPLRNRTDTFEFATDQMLASTLLFTTVVFLFPTMAVYYVYFAFIRASVRLVQETLTVIAYFLLHLPLFPTVYWLRYRSLMKGGLVLSAPKVTMRRLPQPGGGTRAASGVAHTVDMTVLAAPLPLYYMLTDFLVTLNLLVKPFLPKHVISLFWSGTADHGVGPIGELAPHLVANCVDPPCTLC